MHASSPFLIAAAVIAMWLGFADPANAEKLELPVTHLHGKPLSAWLHAPVGAAKEKRPAVVMLHGCGGIGANDELNARHRMWAEWLVERGHVVLFPLSFSSRGLQQQCTVARAERTIRPADRVADVLAAQAWLAARPDIDASRIVLWGFSHGGSSTLATLSAGAAAQGRFQQAIAFYPGCSAYAQAAARGERLTLAAPLQIFIGEADDWTPAAPCHAWVEALRKAGQPAAIVGYPGAFHDFDNPTGRVRVRADVPNGVNPGKGVTVGPDPAAREDVKRRIAALLATGAQAPQATSAPGPLRSVAGVELPAPWPAGDAADTHWGTTVPDPYRALENTRDEAVQRWLRAQGEATERVLGRIPGRAALLSRIEALDADARGVASSLVRTDDGRLFFLRRNPGDQQAKLVLRERLDADPAADRVLIDPDALSRAAGRPVAIMDYAPSPDGTKLVYTLQAGGAEIGELRLIEVEGAKLLAGPIDRVRFGNPNWLPDGSGFFYSRLREGFDQLPASQRFGDTQRVYRAIDGTEHVVFSASRYPQLGLPPIASAGTLALPGRPLLLAVVHLGVDRNLVLLAARLADVKAGRPAWRRIVAQSDEVHQVAAAADGSLILRSAKGAPRFKLLRWELPDDLEQANLAQAQPLLAQGDAVITNVEAARDALYIVRRQGVNATLWRLPAGAREPQPVVLPVQGTVSVREANPQRDGVIVSLGSWTRASSEHLLLPAADAAPRLQPLTLAQPGAFDAPPGLVSREVMVRSHDGAMVPASILHREGLKLDGSNPTLLYGYGAYGMFEAPGFGARRLAWFEQGGVYVIAHVRGGGVFGEAWHRAGQKTTKLNTWRDGIAVAEWLIREGYTTAARLAVQGGSAGGIFVGRAATERPDLFAAAISGVGVLDTVRSETRANGVANVPEYGSVAKEDEFHALLRNSSYHALAEGTRYPAFLLVHGVNDTRVDVWQSSKFAAKAQALKSQIRPVLMLLDFEAGHGSGTSRNQAQRRLADQWAFLLWQFGMPGFQPQPLGQRP